jgi:hypothetical protein
VCALLVCHGTAAIPRRLNGVRVLTTMLENVLQFLCLLPFLIWGFRRNRGTSYRPVVYAGVSHGLDLGAGYGSHFNAFRSDGRLSTGSSSRCLRSE